MIIEYMLSSLWFIFPAYVANAAPVFVRCFKNSRPIDGNRLFFDKRLIFGKGKTRTGFVLGVLAGTLTGALQIGFNSTIPVVEIPMTLELAILLSVGAMLGDLVASFIKRRMGIKRGDPIFLLDQLDFVIGAILFAGTVVDVPFYMWAVLFIITPITHYISNLLSYALKLKDVWW
ncbi:MAG: CDP-2,3-bis-(O-geranylgeranyl)-sn-glycerol synthase [Candidatus Aenigmatarchaeota archaeon]|nr:MAG: CDP-2,3-bis-(O-geranylgeranyl)-sn-glycerol synthase [Candidatus Aenigmarchaeota archaeon]